MCVKARVPKAKLDTNIFSIDVLDFATQVRHVMRLRNDTSLRTPPMTSFCCLPIRYGFYVYTFFMDINISMVHVVHNIFV